MLPGVACHQLRGLLEVADMLIIVMLIPAALLVGFLAGLRLIRLAERWCPECGANTVALMNRHRRGAHSR